MRFGQALDGVHERATVEAQIVHQGATLLGPIDAAVACGLDPVDAHRAVEIFLQLAKALRDTTILRAGLTVGMVQRQGSRFEGEALVRAETLGEYADIGQLLVEQRARERLRGTYLFGEPRQFGSSLASALDGRHPRLGECAGNRRALSHASLARVRGDDLSGLASELRTEGARGLVLRAEEPFDTLDMVTELANALRPVFVMPLRRHSDRLQPLGSLVGAIASLDLAARPERTAHLDPAGQDTLRRLQAGQAVTRSQAITSLSALLTPPAGKPWLVCDQLADLDAATLSVVSDLLTLPDGPLVICCMRPSDELPAALSTAPLLDRTLRPPTTGELTTLAKRVLSDPPDPQLEEQVVRLGGPTALGVIEACHALVLAGDLVPLGSGLGWRVAPRTARTAVTAQASIGEQLSVLSPSAFRLLEAVCVSPPCSTRAFVEAVGREDGLSHAEVESALDELREQLWLDHLGHLTQRHREIRQTVLDGMPPPRSAELHRFAATVVQHVSAGHEQGFGGALLGYYWWHGGRQAQAASSLMDTAEQAVRFDFGRCGVGLAATAVRIAADDGLRRRAREVVRQVDRARREYGPSAKGTGDGDAADATAHAAIVAACHALQRSDPDEAERLLDRAVSDGWGPAAAGRLRAMAQLRRGSAAAARETLLEGPPAHARWQSEPRNALAWALVHLVDGDPTETVRRALTALAACLDQPADRAGQAAAFATLSLAYNALGQTQRAEALASRATNGPG